jgi:DNA-binding transcriptional LysR family regulator
MELRHLRYFVATAEELHFTRAARRLGIAQPPLTQQIKALEAELNLKLFDRLPGRVELTDAGRIFLEDAQRILDSVGRAVARSQSSARGAMGRLAIGFTESASFSPIVTASLRRYRRDFPNIELSFEEARSTQLVQLLRQGRIDAAFARHPVRSLRRHPDRLRTGRVQSGGSAAGAADFIDHQLRCGVARHRDRPQVHDAESFGCRLLYPAEISDAYGEPGSGLPNRGALGCGDEIHRWHRTGDCQVEIERAGDWRIAGSLGAGA